MRAASTTPPASLDRIAALDRDRHLAGVELSGDEQVVDDRPQPVGLGGDHAEELIPDRRIELDVRTPNRLRRAVDCGQRCPQLVRDRGDEVRLDLLERALLGQVAERVDRALLEADAGPGDPELAATELDRHGLGPHRIAGLARHGYQR